MIKVLFFDFDGVLTTDFNGTGNICENLCKAVLNLSIEPVLECYRKHCGCLLTEPGKFSDVWDAFCVCIGQPITPDILRKALRTVSRNEEMFVLVQSLRKKYRLGMITDNATERMDLLNEDMRLTDLFDPMIISASVRALKHDGTTTIFDAALEGAGCEPEESIFIDNQERNLVTPSTMGMKTYWHDDSKNDIPSLVSALQKYGVEIEK